MWTKNRTLAFKDWFILPIFNVFVTSVWFTRHCHFICKVILCTVNLILTHTFCLSHFIWQIKITLEVVFHTFLSLNLYCEPYRKTALSYHCTLCGVVYVCTIRNAKYLQWIRQKSFDFIFGICSKEIASLPFLSASKIEGIFFFSKKTWHSFSVRWHNAIK